jgi:OOP family OmpA-OmpF porin
MKRLLIFCFAFFCAVNVSAQSRRDWMEFGDQAFLKKDYKLALTCYQHVVTFMPGSDRDLVTPYECRPYIPPKKTVDSAALSKASQKPDSAVNKLPPVQGNDPRTRYVTHRIAECYRLLHDYDNAELWYALAAQIPDERFPEVRYWYGIALMNNAKYDDASKQFETYLATLPQGDARVEKVTRNINGCLFAQDTAHVKKAVRAWLLDSVINAGTTAFAATYYSNSDQLLFTSGRAGNASSDSKKEQGLDAYTTDVYMATRVNGIWLPPQQVKTSLGTLNTPVNEGAASVSFGLQHLFFTRWSEDGQECAIFLSRSVGEEWLAPLKLNAVVNIPGTRAMHPCMSNDGTTLYFASDREGGFGGLDIWAVQLDEDGNASNPVNMGPLINSAGDEITPFFHFTSGTLFYSTNGMGGFGGFDIVKTAFNADDSTWSQPRNLDAPFNSSRDDAYFVLDRLQQEGYFSSDREKCATCGPSGNGYCYRAYQFQNEPLVFSLKGHVYNVETNEPIGNALLTFKDIRGDQETFYIITDSTGYYETSLTLNQELYIKAQKNKFFGDATNISTVGLTDSKQFEHDFFLTPIPAGEIVIPGIEYDFDRATLRPESQKILDDLAKFLELNDNISVEISSHTDARGSDKYNERLSQDRAKSCVDYLISKGISPDRLVAKGYGEKQPLITEADINKLPTKDEQEAAHQRNRRTAFRPIREGVIMDKWEGNMPK